MSISSGVNTEEEHVFNQRAQLIAVMVKAPAENRLTAHINVPIIGCKGNHEGSGDLFYKYWPYPYESNFYWSFDYGPVHVVVLDQYVPYSQGSTQYNWLENDLAMTTKPWKIIVFHEPGWSAGGGHDNNSVVQDNIQPLCETYGVDVVFAGHNHYYARADVNGIQHITTGGGGAPIYTPDSSYPYVVAAEKEYHFCEIEIQGEALYLTARDTEGSVIDAISLIKTDAGAEIVSTWSDGIWYYNVTGSSWTQMTSDTTTGDIAAGDFTSDGKADVASCWEDYGLWYQDGTTLAWTKVSDSAPDRLTAGDVSGK